ncbi:MAG: hypothetical protein AAGE52_01450 [Myxococcota bacterium]
MRAEDMDEATVRELYFRFCRLASAVVMSKLSQKEKPKVIPWDALFVMWMGYMQTEFDIHHPCGEDFSEWRAWAAEDGIEVPEFDEHRQEQRDRYAEVMAPVVAERALQDAKGGGDE